MSDPTAPAVGDLRCEHRRDPLGIDVVDPRLRWVASSPRQGAVQRRARVRVASSPELLAAGGADLWDPGWIDGPQPEVTYAGRPLGSGDRAHWTVAVEDDEGVVSPWAAPAWWEQVLGADGWTADWIATPCFAVPHLRAEVDLPTPVVSARLYVTALGIYRASINGRRVGDDCFRPGWTDYRRRVQVQTYDVAALLHEGRNALGLVVTDGWYSGRIGWYGERRHYGDTPQVRAQLVVRHVDGTTTTFGTDGTWQGRAGPVITTDFLTGERYDARLELEGWDEPGYAPPWTRGEPATVVPAPSAELVASAAEPVRVTEVLAPRAVHEPVPGTFVLDVGQNLVGWARIRVEGAGRGDVIRLRYAEALQPDGRIYTDNLRMAQAVDEYTCKGEAVEEWEPTFTFHGFRYIEVTGWPGGTAPPEGAVVAAVAHSDLERTGIIETSELMVEQLLANIDWGLRSNFLEVPTDCPQRDERLGWMGDIQVFAATACATRDVSAFLTKWMWDVVDAQSAEGAFSDVAPRVVHRNDGAAAWGDAGVIVPWRLYEWYGDERIVRTHRRAAAAWVDFIAEANPDGRWLQRRGFDAGDWLSIRADTPKHVLATAFHAHSADLAARMAAVAGDASEAARLGEIADRAKAAFNEHHVRADGWIEGDTQTAYALALRFDLLPDALRPLAAARLAADVAERDFHASVGFVGVPHLLPALTDWGYHDHAVKVLLQRTFPSWGHQIDNGATTMWERWDGWTPDGGFQAWQMNSFNHYAFGAVGEWITTRLVGIGPDSGRPGFGRARLRPRPGDGLEWARGSFRSVRGTFTCGWSRHPDGSVGYEATVPMHATALLELDGAEPQELGPGVHRVTV